MKFRIVHSEVEPNLFVIEELINRKSWLNKAVTKWQAIGRHHYMGLIVPYKYDSESEAKRALEEIIHKRQFRGYVVHETGELPDYKYWMNPFESKVTYDEIRNWNLGKLLARE